MQYLLLIYETPKAFAARDDGPDSPYVAAWRVYYRELVAAGAYVSGAPLQAVHTATTVRTAAGKERVQDGPYADTKEQLGGFILIEAPSLDAALALAARCPTAADGAVEVRPLQPELHDRVVRD